MVLRYLLQTWLHSTARQQVRQRVMEAAQQQMEAALHGAQGGQAPEAPCQVGAVFALGIEAGGLEDLLEGVVTTRGPGFVVREGGLSGRRIVLMLSGAGRPAAAKATEALIVGHSPQWVLSAGFAGGLDPTLPRTHIVVADRLLDIAGGQLAIDLPSDPALPLSAPGVHVGPLLTSDAIVRLPKEKQSLWEQYHALAVDMETFAVAEVCRHHGVRFLAVRVINDAADDELPRDVEKLLAQKTGAARLGAALGAVLNRPSSLKDMYQLKENALVASDRLAKFLARAIKLLPVKPWPDGGSTTSPGPAGSSGA